jgi:pimeloyl-ACP methyl ester carboxylesterase
VETGSGNVEQFSSNDGTRIAYERRGEGPVLVLVHGTGIDHSYWDPVVPELELRFTLYIPDRRGRGQSGNAEPYDIQREVEDVVTLIESLPSDVFVLGHSYGALCSLESSLLTTHISRIVLNEPPIYTSVEVDYPADAADRFLALLEAGEAEQALVLLHEAGGTSTAELDLLRSLPNWQARVQAAPTLPREIISVKNYTFDPARFGQMNTPVLLLLGGATIPVYTAAIEALHAALPNNRLVVLEGQGHDAVITAPDRYAREVIDFLLGERD